jgi:hypothetical protein
MLKSSQDHLQSRIRTLEKPDPDAKNGVRLRLLFTEKSALG